jgi:RNA polymerase sigma-70 factor (ECF subfamily)
VALPESEPSEPNDAGDESFAALLGAARAGSAEASGRLIDRFRPYLLLIANQDLGVATQAKVGASDLVQDAMLSAQRAIGEFRGETAQELRGWLRRILLNDILQTQRKFTGTAKRQIGREIPLDHNDSQRGTTADPACLELTPSDQVIAEEEAETLRRAMDQLPAEYQQVLRLRNWQDLSFVEIGRQMNRSPEAARKLWSRAVMQLQGILNRHESSPRNQ